MDTDQQKRDADSSNEAPGFTASILRVAWLSIALGLAQWESS